MDKNTDYLERISRVLTIAAFSIAAIVAFVAPLMAISWAKRPFPGFMVEQTLIVNGIGSDDWAGKAAGIDYPQQVIRVAGIEVNTGAAFDAVLRNQEVGAEIAVMTRLPDGTIQLYPAVALSEFPTSALVRNFWVLYLIGFVYLGIGIWVYLVRGKSLTGRALAFFCATTSLGTMLIFDLSSTHLLVTLWISAVALAAGSLFSLGMRFPVEWHIVQRRPWALALPYAVSILLSVWAMFITYNVRSPWAYITNWEATYRFAAVSILAFLGLSIYLAFSNQSFRIRQQSRIVLLGAAVAFTPVAVMFIASRRIGFHVYLLAFLPAFPISVAVAVMRYNLWKVDSLINRAILYGVLTTLLAGLFTALDELLETIFVVVTGEDSNAALIITAFIVAATVKPVQRIIDQFINRRMGTSMDNTQKIKAFGDQIRSHLFFNDPDKITVRLLEEIGAGLNAESCAVIVNNQGNYEVSHIYGPWRGNAVASLPLKCQDRHFGTLFIGPNAFGSPYSPEDFNVLQDVTDQAAKAIYLSTQINLDQVHSEQHDRTDIAKKQQDQRSNGNETIR